MISSLMQSRTNNATVVTVSSSLTGLVYFYWYTDGAYVGFSTTGRRTFLLVGGDQSRLDVLDSNDGPDVFDPEANAPAGYGARRTLIFTRSIDAAVARYRIEEKKGAGSWTAIGFLQDLASAWQYRFVTGRLEDLGVYQWRVVPISAAGNDGTPTVLAEGLGGGGVGETVVRTPDAPAFTATFDPGTTKVTFAEAA